MNGKRGDVSDIFVILIIIFFLAISFIVVIFVNDKLRHVVSDTPLNSTSAADDIIRGMDNVTTKGVNQGFMIIFGFLVVGVMVSSFMVRVHPAFIFLYIIFAGLAVILAVVMSNTYNTFIENEVLADYAENQTAMNYIMLNLVKVTIGIIGLSMVILFAKLPDRGVI